MTPMAKRIVNQLCLPIKQRNNLMSDPEIAESMRKYMHDIHCFEVTQILPLVNEVSQSVMDKSAKEFGYTVESDIGFERKSTRMTEDFQKLLFLPAPKIWLECKDKTLPGHYWAWHVEEDPRPPENSIEVVWFHSTPTEWLQRTYIGNIIFKEGGIGFINADKYVLNKELSIGSIQLLTFLLAIINSPKIIGRNTILPNPDFQKRATKHFGEGKFPLRAWTEILLKVHKPPEIDDGEPHETHLSGRRALHFVRKHIRIRLGQLEYVSAHWRGDPAIGIKRSRYKVTP